MAFKYSCLWFLTGVGPQNAYLERKSGRANTCWGLWSCYYHPHAWEREILSSPASTEKWMSLAQTSKVFTCNLLKRLKMKYEGIIEEEQAAVFSPLQQERTIEHLFWLKVITEKLSDNLEQNSSCILVSLTSNKLLIYWDPTGPVQCQGLSLRSKQTW